MASATGGLTSQLTVAASIVGLACLPGGRFRCGLRPRGSQRAVPAHRSDLLRNADHDQKDERHNGDQPQGSRQPRDPRLPVAGTAEERMHSRALRDPSSARRDPGATSVPRPPRSHLGAGMSAAQDGLGEVFSRTPVPNRRRIERSRRHRGACKRTTGSAQRERAILRSRRRRQGASK